MTAVVRIHARAKINLFLKVGRRRSDGYHDIETLFQSISLSDRLTVRRLPPGGLRIRVDDPSVPSGRKNTVYKAYRYLKSVCPEAGRSGWSVDLQKNIPHGSGLGGASADAAAFLIAAWRLLGERPRLAPADMSRIAREIGADVPFCLLGGSATGAGRGENLRPARPFPPMRIFVVVPNVKISTKSAYAALDRDRRKKNLTKSRLPLSLKAVVRAVKLRKAPGHPVNDFQAVAVSAHSQLSGLAGRLAALGYSAMTGSGSAFFVIPKRGVSVRAVRRASAGFQVIAARFVRKGAHLMP